MASLLTSASDQRRDKARMYADERLCRVARARAMDMARRGYFSHVNPDGHGPNYLVRQTGYPLPSHYSTSKSGNNIESIGCGYSNASAAWSAWMGSSGHKTHLLATESFYRDQTAYGVGYYYDPGSPYGRYYVVLTAPPAGDTLTITSPSSGARVVSNQVTVTGQVSGSAVVAQMVYRLENASGTSNWQSVSVPTGTGVGNWSANVSGLAVGTNTVRVRTLDSSGTLMKETSRNVRLAVMRPLTVAVSGDGTVTGGFLGTTQREVGTTYTVQALANAGALFSHWEGFPVSESRNLRRAAQTFTMTEGLSLRAHFIPNPFLARSGAYEGLVLGGSLDHASTGVLRLALTKTGGFSGLLIVGSSQLTVRGTLNSAGQAVVTLARPDNSALTLHLQLDLSNPAGALTASLTDGSSNWSITTDRRALPEPGTPAVSKRFTFRIDPNTSAPGTPQGYGYGVAAVSAANIVTITGKLADGRPLTARAGLTADGKLSVYARQFGITGAFAASLQISEEGVLSGNGRWMKPERPADLRYSAAFNTTHALVGGLYVAPTAGTRAMAWEPSGAGSLSLSHGNLETALAQSVVLGTNNVFSWDIANATIPSLRVALVASSGAVSGTFRHSNGTIRAFRGVVIQHLGGAWGHFLGTTDSGAFALQAGAQ